MPTITDVAKKAGVGTTTVSRVLNNSPKVSEEAKSKVLRAMNELNYYPNSHARGLAGLSTFTIGLIMDNTMDKAFANPFIYEVFRGIEKSVYEAGYNLLLLGKNTMQNNKLAIENVLKGRLLDGLILPPEIVDSDYFSKISSYKLPIVATGSILKKDIDISTVDIDNYMAGYSAAEYLFERGYRKIGFSGIDYNKRFARDRYEGYIKFLNEKGLKPVAEADLFCEADSIICLDNIWAYKVLQKIKEIKMRIPDEIGLITFDNYPLAEYLDPPITNVEIDLYQLGVKVGEEILKKVKDRKGACNHIKIPPFINVRSSTK